MASYKIFLKRSATSELRALPKKTRQRLVACIRQLATQPRPGGVEKLKGFDGMYRIRSGDYRVVYEINDAVVTVMVIKVGHRKDVYR